MARISADRVPRSFCPLGDKVKGVPNGAEIMKLTDHWVGSFYHDQGTVSKKKFSCLGGTTGRGKKGGEGCGFGQSRRGVRFQEGLEVGNRRSCRRRSP